MFVFQECKTGHHIKLIILVLFQRPSRGTKSDINFGIDVLGANRKMCDAFRFSCEQIVGMNFISRGKLPDEHP